MGSTAEAARTPGPDSRWTAEVEARPDLKEPVLPGTAPSDYQRYLRVPELLALQPDPHTWLHRDELLFTVTHQTSELWLALANSEIEEATRLLDAGAILEATRILGRVHRCLVLLTVQLDVLEEMSPAEFAEVRRALGHGSGFDSPGFLSFRRQVPGLGRAFLATLGHRGLALDDLYRTLTPPMDLYLLAEAMLDIDEQVLTWRERHLRVVQRAIGGAVHGIQGLPVEALADLRDRQLFPELWAVRDRVTIAAGTSEGSGGTDGT